MKSIATLTQEANMPTRKQEQRVAQLRATAARLGHTFEARELTGGEYVRVIAINQHGEVMTWAVDRRGVAWVES